MSDDAHLLPSSASTEERGISSAVAKRLSSIPTPIPDLWRPYVCPATHLSWLAWALSVDDWDPDWPEETRRAVIAESIELHRHKGTPWAVKQSLIRLGFANVEILEGTNIRLDGSHTLDGSWTLGNQFGPYEFGVLLNAAEAVSGGTTSGLTPELIAEINRRIDAAKNERSKLVELYSYMLYLDGTWALDGTEILNGGLL